MLKSLNIVLYLFVLIGFSACSGMVQTNPIPNPTKYALPKNPEIELVSAVSAKDIKDFDNYAREFFKVHLVDLRKSIWSIGLERGHYDQNNH